MCTRPNAALTIDTIYVVYSVYALTNCGGITNIHCITAWVIIVSKPYGILHGETNICSTGMCHAQMEEGIAGDQ